MSPQEFPPVQHISPGAAAADRSVLPTKSPAKSCAFWEPTRRTMNGLRHEGEVPQGLGAGSHFLLTLSGVWEKKWLRQSLTNPLKELAIFDKMQLIKLFKYWIIESNTSRTLVWVTMGSQVLFLQLISKSHRTVLEGDISCVLTLSKNLICRHGTT